MKHKNLETTEDLVYFSRNLANICYFHYSDLLHDKNHTNNQFYLNNNRVALRTYQITHKSIKQSIKLHIRSYEQNFVYNHSFLGINNTNSPLVFINLWENNQVELINFKDSLILIQFCNPTEGLTLKDIYFSYVFYLYDRKEKMELGPTSENKLVNTQQINYSFAVGR